ncbi:undecaprenyl-diphosphatase, partial [Candidatus Bathyarchaeota archaeon]
MLEAILLAFIQGITEWLPISSSGHLALIQQMLQFKSPVFFDVMLHLGTLIVILIVFREKIVKITKTVYLKNLATSEGKILKLVIVGNIPIGIAYILFGNDIKAMFSNAFAVAIAFLATGVVLFLTIRTRDGKDELTYMDSILIGIAQAFALIPGLSRSGLTIAIALLLGVKREQAAEFSFLLAIPAIIGAAIEESLTHKFTEIEILPILVGVMVAIAVGYVALKLLLRIVQRGKLYVFSVYCWLVGAVT